MNKIKKALRERWRHLAVGAAFVSLPSALIIAMSKADSIEVEVNITQPIAIQIRLMLSR